MKLHWSSKVAEEPCSKAPHSAIKVSRAPVGPVHTRLELRFTCILEHMQVCEQEGHLSPGLVYWREEKHLVIVMVCLLWLCDY